MQKRRVQRIPKKKKKRILFSNSQEQILLCPTDTEILLTDSVVHFLPHTTEGKPPPGKHLPGTEEEEADLVDYFHLPRSLLQSLEDRAPVPGSSCRRGRCRR